MASELSKPAFIHFIFWIRRWRRICQERGPNRPMRKRRGWTQYETRRPVSQQLSLLFQRGEESFCAGTESDPGGRPSREADPRPAVPPSFQECVWETQGRVQQPVNNWEQLPPLWADWPRRLVITLARTCCCFISATLLLRNNDGN